MSSHDTRTRRRDNGMQPRYHKGMETQATTIRLPEDLYERLRREAYETRTSQAAIITKALTEHYERLDSEASPHA